VAVDEADDGDSERGGLGLLGLGQHCARGGYK